MRVVAVVQARMGSSRLPGKVLMDVCGRPMLGHTLGRLSASSRLDEIVVATSDRPPDDPLQAFVKRQGFPCHRGSEVDVLHRFRDAAAAHKADVVVRITADCPLVDAEIVDLVVNELVNAAPSCDYASNAIVRTYPRGLDTEALWWDVLERIHRLGRSESAREHVTWFAYKERPDLFVLRSVEIEEALGDVDWSVDTVEDLDRVRKLLLAAGNDAGWRQLLAAS